MYVFCSVTIYIVSCMNPCVLSIVVEEINEFYFIYLFIIYNLSEKMRGSKRSSSIALGKTENLLSSRERVAIEIPNEETRHLLEYQVTIL